MTFRVGTVADRDVVVALALHFHASTAYSQLLTVDPERIAALFHVALVHGVVFLAVRADETVVGFIGVVADVHRLSGDRYAEEAAWWVEPEARSGIVGPKLLALAELWARQHACAFIVMLAPVGTPVGHFYDRLGYQPIETAWMKRLDEKTMTTTTSRAAGRVDVTGGQDLRELRAGVD